MQRTITVVYQFHRARKSRDSSPSLQRVVPYHRGRLHAYSSLPFSLYFRLYSIVRLVSQPQRVHRQTQRGGLYSQPAYGYEAYNGTRRKEGGKSGPAEDDVRVKWLRYRILADAICAIPSVQRTALNSLILVFRDLFEDRSFLHCGLWELAMDFGIFPWKIIPLENKIGS